MSDRAIAFVEEWVENNIHPDTYLPEGGDSRAKALAAQCTAEAIEAGIPVSEMNEAFNNLADFLANEIERIHDEDVDRPDDKDDAF